MTREVPIDSAAFTQMRMSVQLGLLFIPARQLLDVVVRHCHPLLVDNDNDDFPLSVIGSSLLISYRGQNIQMFSEHQLSNCERDARDVRLVETHPQRLIFPPVSASRPGDQIPELENLRDIVFCNYPSNLEGDLSSRFLQLSGSQFVPAPIPEVRKVLVYFFIGFPGQAVDYQLRLQNDALEHLRARWIRIHLEPISETIFPVPNRTHLRSTDSFADMEINPDGISGSPVFAVYQTTDLQLHFGFCGIITHANNDGVCAIIDAPIIKKMLDAGIET